MAEPLLNLGLKAAKLLKETQPLGKLADWFGNSKVVDPHGAPLPVYRGEHGAPDLTQPFQSRLGSLSFGDVDTANLYATQPNNYRDVVQAPRVTPGYLKIENPIVHAIDDPFLELGHLQSQLGTPEAMRIAKKFSEDIKYTNNWEDNFADRFDSVKQLLKDKPDALKDLYFSTHKYLDDPNEIELLKKRGFDGAIHLGSGGTRDAVEYRIFDPNNFRSLLLGK